MSDMVGRTLDIGKLAALETRSLRSELPSGGIQGVTTFDVTATAPAQLRQAVSRTRRHLRTNATLMSSQVVTSFTMQG
jgi:hypothetical protein